MAGFVGYCVHATGFHWPWAMSGGGILGGQVPGQLYEEGSHLVPNPAWFPAYNGGEWPTLVNGDVPALWDQMSDPAKWQILLTIMFFEVWGEYKVRVMLRPQSPTLRDRPATSSLPMTVHTGPASGYALYARRRQARPIPIVRG